MYLRQRLEAVAETLRDFSLAAEERYQEGVELATAGHAAAGIYLLGYAAEMWLKVASFRFDGAVGNDLISPRLAPAKNWLKIRAPHMKPENFHSLAFWVSYLFTRRAAAAHRLPTTLSGELLHRVRRIYLIWWIEMRYRPDQALSDEVTRVYRDVTWLREVSPQLHR